MSAARFCVIAAVMLSAAPLGLRGATLEADYQFQNTFASSVNGGTAPDLTVAATGNGTNTNAFTTDTVYGQTRTVYAFSNNYGLGAITSGVISPANYSIVMDAKLVPLATGSGASPAAKLIDFNNLLADTGLYNLSNALDFFDVPTAVGTSAQGLTSVDQYAQIVLTRDAATDPANPVVTAYVGGAEACSFVDSSDLALLAAPGDPTTQALHFFMNDNVGIVGDNIDPESQSGDVARIRLYDGALTADEVAALAAANNVPEPASVALLAAGAMVLLGRRRARG